jgi:[ribosomal protein S5]-alanine N-acetyltransferase
MIKNSEFHIIILKPEDAKSLSKMMLLNFDNFKRYFPVTSSKNKSTEDSLKYIEEKRKENESKSEFTFGIKDISNSNIAGLIIIKEINWETKQGEFAYCTSSKYENKGWMSKAIALTTKYGFETLGFEKFQIIAHKTNVGSCKVAEKCGFEWKKTLLNEYTPPNEAPLDMELYELEYER